MSDEHPNAKPAAQSPVQESGHRLLLRDVLPTVPETLRQRRHHVLVVLHQRPGGTCQLLRCLLHLLEYRGVLGDIVEVQKLRKVIEYVEGSDVEFMLQGNYNSRVMLVICDYQEIFDGGHG